MATQVKKPAAGARRKPTQKASGGRSARSRAAGAGNGGSASKGGGSRAAGAGNGASASKRAASRPAKVAAKAAKATAKEAITPGSSPVSGLARKAAGKTARFVGRKALEAGRRALRSALEQSSDAGRRALDAGLSRRLPIQVSIDVAVPVRVVWDEWTAFESICEGVDMIEDIERDGDMLFGRLAGAGGRDWEAEILDERELESFAWRSVKGSDCAGLVTFHELGERLTRIELDLDVVPAGPLQALSFASHMAHRRAEAELRRFKARLEFINPDVYMDAVEQDAAERAEADAQAQDGGDLDDESETTGEDRAGADDTVDDDDEAVDDG